MRRTLCTMLLLVILFQWSAPALAVGTSAASAILIDADTGRVLYEQNADEPRLIASITKIMTAPRTRPTPFRAAIWLRAPPCI